MFNKIIRKDKKELYIKIAVFVLILILNFLTVYVADDYGYSENNGFLDIFVREYHQYFNWTGRSVAHILARIFLLFPKFIFNIFNSLCFMYLIQLIHDHVLGNNKDFNLVVYLLSLTSIFIFIPSFGEVILWEVGSCNYMWTTTIILSFLLRYRLSQNNEDIKYNSILMFLFGIIAGWTNENTGGALILALLFISIYIWLKHRYETWMFTGSIGCFIGFLMLINAPGNKIRAQEFPVNTQGNIYYIVHEILYALDIFKNKQLYMWIIIAIAIGLIIYKKKELNKIYDIFLYAFSGIAGICAIILSPSPLSYDRSMFGSTILIVIAFVLALYLLHEYLEFNKLSISVLSILALLTIFNYGIAFFDLAYTKYQNIKRETFISKQFSLGNLNPVLPYLDNEFNTVYNPVTYLTDLSNYRHMWANESFAKYHDLETVQGTSLDKFNLIYKDGDPRLINILDFNEYVDEIINKDYLVMVTSTNINSKDYTNYLSSLKKLGLELKDNCYINALIDLKDISNKNIDDTPTSISFNYNDSNIYINSSNNKVEADILINNIEYTNNQEGISFVIYDPTNQKVIDSFTLDYKSLQGLIRSDA